MDDVCNIPGIKPIKIVHVQRVRMHLGVTTKADICTSDGKALCEWAMKVSDNPRPPTFCFPRQDKPRATNIIATWRRVIRLCYSMNDTYKLDAHLGEWHTGRIRQIWDTAIDPDTGIIHRWHDGVVRQYEQRSRNQYQYRRNSRTNSFPLRCTPVSGRFQSGLFVTSGYEPRVQAPAPTISSTTDQLQRMFHGTLIRRSR